MNNKRVGKHTNKREAVKNNRRGSPLAPEVPYDVPSTEDTEPKTLRVHVVKPGISIEQIMANIKGINDGDSVFGKETLGYTVVYDEVEHEDLSNGESEVVHVSTNDEGRKLPRDNGSGEKPIRKQKSKGRKSKPEGKAKGEELNGGH